MQIDRNPDKQHFTSRIRFVDKRTFDLLQCLTPKESKILSYDIFDKSGYLLNKNKVVTTDVRTCTGGFIIDPEKGIAPLSIHLRNSASNLEEIDNLEKFLKGRNAFFIGAKRRVGCRHIEFAREVFKKISELAKAKAIKTTILEGLDDYCGVDLAYWGKKDTILVGLHRIIPQDGKPSKKEYIQINDINHLRKFFEKIRIAQGDEIEFNQPLSLKEIAEFKLN